MPRRIEIPLTRAATASISRHDRATGLDRAHGPWRAVANGQSSQSIADLLPERFWPSPRSRPVVSPGGMGMQVTAQVAELNQKRQAPLWAASTSPRSSRNSVVSMTARVLYRRDPLIAGNHFIVAEQAVFIEQQPAYLRDTTDADAVRLGAGEIYQRAPQLDRGTTLRSTCKPLLRTTLARVSPAPRVLMFAGKARKCWMTPVASAEAVTMSRSPMFPAAAENYCYLDVFEVRT